MEAQRADVDRRERRKSGRRIFDPALGLTALLSGTVASWSIASSSPLSRRRDSPSMQRQGRRRTGCCESRLGQPAREIPRGWAGPLRPDLPKTALQPPQGVFSPCRYRPGIGSRGHVLSWGSSRACTPSTAETPSTSAGVSLRVLGRLRPSGTTLKRNKPRAVHGVGARLTRPACDAPVHAGCTRRELAL